MIFELTLGKLKTEDCSLLLLLLLLLKNQSQEPSNSQDGRILGDDCSYTDGSNTNSFSVSGMTNCGDYTWWKGYPDIAIPENQCNDNSDCTHIIFDIQNSGKETFIICTGGPIVTDHGDYSTKVKLCASADKYQPEYQTFPRYNREGFQVVCLKPHHSEGL